MFRPGVVLRSIVQYTSCCLQAASSSPAAAVDTNKDTPAPSTTTMTPPSPSSSSPLQDSDLDDYYIKTFFPSPLASHGAHHFATAQLVRAVPEEEDTFIIAVDDICLSPVVEVGSRVYVNMGTSQTLVGTTIGGVVVKVNSNRTLGVLLDNNDYNSQLPQNKVCLCSSRSHFTLHKEYINMVKWMKDAGVGRHGDQERLCSVLYTRGWREKDLHMLEGPDIHCMIYLKRSVRLLVLEKAEWQRSYHAEMRSLLRERFKERSWRYFIQKYSGFVSANFAGLGVLSVFLWNFKNYRKHQRSFQMNYAVNTMKSSVARKSDKIKANLSANTRTVGALLQTVKNYFNADETTPSEKEEEEVPVVKGTTPKEPAWEAVTSVPHRNRYARRPSRRQPKEEVVEEEDEGCVGESAVPGQENRPASPPAFSDSGAGTGSNFVVEREEEEKWLRRVINRLDILHPRVTVVTGYHGCGKSTLFRTAVSKEDLPALFVEVRGSDDTLTAILRSLKVPNIDMCGDPTEFIAEAFALTTKATGKTPILVLSLRQGSDLKRVYTETVSLACDRMLCHLVLEVALENISIAHLNIPRVDFYKVPNFTRQQAFEYTEYLVDPVAFEHFVEVVGTNSDDIDELYAAVVHRRTPVHEFTNSKLCKAMRQLQEAWEGEEEVRHALRLLASLDYEMGQHVGADQPVLQSPCLSGIVLYDPVQHRWLFTRKVFHTAVRCLAKPLLPIINVEINPLAVVQESMRATG